MSNVLFTKNKIGFVDGSILIPNSDSRKLSYWKRCNAMVRGWLTSAMSKEIRSSVKHVKTMREIWEERFGKESAPKAYELRRSLVQLKLLHKTEKSVGGNTICFSCVRMHLWQVHMWCFKEIAVDSWEGASVWNFWDRENLDFKHKADA